jgi:hypothetical protein
MSDGLLPLSRAAGKLLGDLRNEIRRLEQECAHFDELPPAIRLSSREAYGERIRMRRELLALLDETPRPPRQ